MARGRRGHLRFYHNVLSPKTKAIPGQSRRTPALFRPILAAEIFPENPWAAYLPLDAYLRPEKKHE